MAQSSSNGHHASAIADFVEKRFELEYNFDQLLKPKQPHLWKDANSKTDKLPADHLDDIVKYVTHMMAEIIQMIP